jgi:hypothetical protein
MPPRVIWPIGTVKRVRVVSADPVVMSGDTTVLAVMEESTKLGFVLLRRYDIMPSVGERGIITLMEGGPTGSYWEYKKQEDQ